MSFWRRLRPWQRDALGAFPFAVGALMVALFDGDVLAAGLIALSYVLITLRRVLPLFALLAAGTACVASASFDGDTTMAIAVIVTLYTVVAYDDRTKPFLAALVGGGSLTGAAIATEPIAGSSRLADIASVIALAVLAMQLGRSVRVNRQASEELRQRTVELERLRAVEANEAVLAERSRIARELHDIAAHHVTGIAVLSRAQARRTELDAQSARDALDVVAREAAEAMTALRSLVSVLRTDADDPNLTPQPGLGELDDLIGAFTRIGMSVTFEGPASVPLVRHDVGLAGYRIVQEALANVMRHSTGSKAWVTVRLNDQSLDITIDDNGPTRPAAHVQSVAGSPRSGHGLIGMTERASLCGGTLVIGPSERGGWCIRASLPTLATEPVPSAATSQQPFIAADAS
jgi:signal transduction histidine kinase